MSKDPKTGTGKKCSDRRLLTINILIEKQTLKINKPTNIN